MHHPMYGMHYNDYQPIIDHFLPVFKDGKFDAFFNGHEHLLNYAQVPKSAFGESESSEQATCEKGVELFPNNGPEVQTRKIVTPQGKKYH